MLNASQLKELRQVDITRVDKSTLVDLRTVSIDVRLPVEQRVQNYLEQIKNPYAFRVGDIAIKLVFENGGRTLEDAVTSYLRTVIR